MREVVGHGDGGDFDLVLVGGGLQNGLIALAVRHAAPACRIAIVDAGATLGGNHTWCVHARDVPDAARPWVAPLVVHRWDGYDVRFPGLSRTVAAPYAAITSARFADVVGRAVTAEPGSALHLGRRAVDVGAAAVTLDDGTVLRGAAVVDARGPDPTAFAGCAGYQKFLGVELQLDAPHRLTRPILMDATVPQTDGFRFFYTLPFAPDRLMVEETYFSPDPTLDVGAGRAAILDYAVRFGTVTHVGRDESGVLPMPWSGSDAPPAASPLVAGYRGGWFHPATGYSFPPAVRLALHVASRPPGALFDDDFAALRRRHATQVRFAHLLNALLFRCFAPADAWNVFARFYRLPDDLIHRFYALETTPLDRARLVVGRPPRGFSIARAFSPGRSP